MLSSLSLLNYVDIDSEEEQIITGVKRLHKSLADAVEFNKMTN